MESFAQRFAKGLTGASFDLGNHPVSGPGVFRELSQEHRLAHAAQPVEHDRLSSAPRCHSIERNPPEFQLMVAAYEGCGWPACARRIGIAYCVYVASIRMYGRV